jgi:predicted dehydrogenase
MTRTRLGFIGAGGIAHRHIAVLQHFDDVEIAAICDPDLSRAREAAASIEAAAYSDTEQMLDAVAVDALFICIPPFAHGAPERAALDRNIPFFVEKPVARDLATAEAIAAAVAKRGLVTGVGYHWRYLDFLDEVRSLITERPVQLLSGYWIDATPPPVWWWREGTSGGQMVEQTSHVLDLARHLVGDAASVYGLTGHLARDSYPGLDVATAAAASVRFQSGAIGNFGSSCLLSWRHRVGLHLFGENYVIEITDVDVMIDVGEGRPVQGTFTDPVWLEDRDFVDAVQGKQNRIRCPYQEGVATLRFALATGESARSGRPIKLQPQR